MNQLFLKFLFSLCLATPLFAADELAISDYFNSLQNKPKTLNELIQAMPKGADLHNHLSGASYAENLLDYAKNDNLCFLKETALAYLDTNCSAGNYLQNIIQDSIEKDKIIDSWSMRNFNPNASERSDQHFFRTFSKFKAISNLHKSEMLAEVINRAAQQNELYLEIMLRADMDIAKELGQGLSWNGNFDDMKKQLTEAGIARAVQQIHQSLNQYKNDTQELLQCKSAKPEKGCSVEVRFIHEIQRENSPSIVFSQLLAAFEAANTDLNLVSVNLVQAENGVIARRDYRLHMQMMAYFHKLYPQIHISLHAGELTNQVVPKEDLSFHITEAIKVAKAERIGHGLDILEENNAKELLTDMANQHILVEINLSSNDHIYQLKGEEHPLRTYLEAKVPLALSTDDEGVNRSNLSKEYLKAIYEHHLSYQTLKEISRNSLHYAFVEGKALFDNYDYTKPNKACADDLLGNDTPSQACQLFLHENKKASLQWELEKRFRVFESSIN
ncbi:MAG: adenosine deaminase [Proteobacteria bacterium]|nr:adenosine deaminase [Pseudomonadota bacterium]